MKRQLLAAATLAAAIGVGGSAEPARATVLTDGKAELDQLCRDKGGQPYFTPYTISRCQEARNKAGFSTEATICEALLGGSFSVADVPKHRNRSNWACVSGPVAP